MNKHIDQSDLIDRILKDVKGDRDLVEAFIQQLFLSIENKLRLSSSAKINELGTFKIIKSGSSSRILFLGASKNAQSSSTNHRLTEKNSISTSPERIEDSIYTNIRNEEIADRLNSLRNSILQDRLARDIKNNTSSEVIYPTNNDIDHIAINNTSFDQTHSSKHKKKTFSIVLITSILGLLLISGVIFIFKEFYPKNTQQSEKTSTQQNNQETITEIQNNDQNKFSSIIISDKDISVENLAIKYYGNINFWPYIYRANESIVDKNHIIKAQTIIRIPKIIVDLAKFHKGELDIHAKDLEKQIN